MNEGMILRGEYEIIIRRAADGEIISRRKIKNQLTTVNQTLRDAQLMGTYSQAADYLQIKYFAFGTGTTQATASDTQLVSEQFRKQLTTLGNPTAGTVESVVSLGTGEANFHITEIGVFCGPNASGTANTGTMLSRVNVNIYKNDSLVVDIVRTDSCVI